jgi:hypothetical protein
MNCIASQRLRCYDDRVSLGDDGIMAYHYDPEIALEELTDEALLPHPSNLRDMIVRAGVGPERAVDLNRRFLEYIHGFGELQSIVRPMLEELAKAKRGSARP